MPHCLDDAIIPNYLHDYKRAKEEREMLFLLLLWPAFPELSLHSSRVLQARVFRVDLSDFFISYMHLSCVEDDLRYILVFS